MKPRRKMRSFLCGTSALFLAWLSFSPRAEAADRPGLRAQRSGVSHDRLIVSPSPLPKAFDLLMEEIARKQVDEPQLAELLAGANPAAMAALEAELQAPQAPTVAELMGPPGELAAALGDISAPTNAAASRPELSATPPELLAVLRALARVPDELAQLSDELFYAAATAEVPVEMPESARESIAVAANVGDASALPGSAADVVAVSEIAPTVSAHDDVAAEALVSSNPTALEVVPEAAPRVEVVAPVAAVEPTAPSTAAQARAKAEVRLAEVLARLANDPALAFVRNALADLPAAPRRTEAVAASDSPAPPAVSAREKPEVRLAEVLARFENDPAVTYVKDALVSLPRTTQRAEGVVASAAPAPPAALPGREKPEVRLAEMLTRFESDPLVTFVNDKLTDLPQKRGRTAAKAVAVAPAAPQTVQPAPVPAAPAPAAAANDAVLLGRATRRIIAALEAERVANERPAVPTIVQEPARTAAAPTALSPAPVTPPSQVDATHSTLVAANDDRKARPARPAVEEIDVADLPRRDARAMRLAAAQSVDEEVDDAASDDQDMADDGSAAVDAPPSGTRQPQPAPTHPATPRVVAPPQPRRAQPAPVEAPRRANPQPAPRTERAAAEPVAQDQPAPATTRPAPRRAGQPVRQRPAVEEIDVRDLRPREDAAQPPAATPAEEEAAPPANRRPPRRPVRPEVAEESAPDQGTEGPPAAATEAAAPPATGGLRGPVSVVTMGDRIIIQGEPADVAYVEALVRQMEAATPEAIIEVIPLNVAKAATIQPIVEDILSAQIDARTGGNPRPADRFSVIAEARSNSLIVAASEENVDRIWDIVEQLDSSERIGESGYRTVQLRNISAAEAVNQLAPVLERFNTLRQTPPEAQAAIEPIDRANSVLIVGTPTDIAEIERLIEAIDQPVPEDADPRDFTTSQLIMIQLKNGLAEQVAEAMLDLIELDSAAAAPAEGGAARRTGRAAARVLRLRLPDGRELPPLDLEKPIRILPEKGTNSLIVASTPKNNESLEEIARVFDTLPAGEATDVRAIALKHASAESVARLIEETFTEAKASLQRPAKLGSSNFESGELPPVPPGLAASGLPYNVGVTFEARSNTIVVVGRSEAVLLASGLIAQLDQSAGNLAGKPHIIRLTNLPAATMAEKLTKVLEDRANALGGAENAARDAAVIVPDDRSNALVVIATEDVYALVEELARRLDSADSYSPVDTRTRRLQFADAAKIQSLLQELFDKKKEAREAAIKDATEQTISLLADTRSNSIVMTGTRDFMDEAERLIDTLDQQWDPTVVFDIIPIKLSSASSIATVLQDMVDKSFGQGAGGGESRLTGSPITITAEPLSNSLAVAASKEDMLLVRRWVEILDRPNEIDRMVRVIPITRGNAEDIAEIAENLVSGGGTGGGAGGGAGRSNNDVTVTHDPTTNSVIAIGPPALVETIATTVRQINETDVAPRGIVRFFPLTQADAETAGELLESILSGEGGVVGGASTTGTGRTTGGATGESARAMMILLQREHEGEMELLRANAGEVTVISDVRTNGLIVTAPPDSMPLIAELIRAIDVPPNAANIRFFALRNADAEQMVEHLEELFEPQTTGGAGRAGGTAAPEGERTLTLEGLAADGGRQEIRFTADTRTNSVIAAGTKGYLDLVQQIIYELDTKAVQQDVPIVYAPKNIKAEEIATTLKSLGDAQKARLEELGDGVSAQRKLEAEIVAISSEEANKVVLSVDERKKPELMRVLNELDQPPPQVMIQVLIIEVSMDNALDLGVEFAFQDLQFAKAGPNDTTTFDYVGGTDVGAAGSGLAGFSFTVSGADFNFLIRTLQNEGSLNVLSRPQIVAMDNQEAVIDISNDVPYVTGTSTSIAGQITTQVARERIGIRLQVTPQINPDGYVRMDIRQEVSDFTGSTVDVGQGVTAPVFFRREAETTVSVKDNETVVLGGLITSRNEKREQKVPLVGDLPLAGFLFRNQEDSTRRSELLVVLTPRVIRTLDDYRELSVSERDQMKLLPDEWLSGPLMQGLQVDPEDLPARDANGNPILPPVQPEPLEPPTAAPPAEEDEDAYGPPRPVRQVSGSPSAAAADDSYETPVPDRLRPGRK